jgi:hypothetical protein
MLILVQHPIFILKMSYFREEPHCEAPSLVFFSFLHLDVGRVKFLRAGHRHPFDLF